MLKAPNYIHKRGERDADYQRCAAQPVSQRVESAGMCVCAFARAGRNERACMKEDRNDSVQLAW